MERVRMQINSSGILPYPLADSKRFILVRNRKDKKWNNPGGKNDGKGESPIRTALREINEETGLIVTIKNSLPRAFLHYENHNGVNTAHYFFDCQYFGGDLNPIDTQSIMEARDFSIEEIRELLGKDQIRCGAINVDPIEAYLEDRRIIGFDKGRVIIPFSEVEQFSYVK